MELLTHCFSQKTYLNNERENKRLENKFVSLKMDFGRRSAEISRIERVRKERIRTIMDTKNAIMEYIQHAQLYWHGHVQRLSEERASKQMKNGISPERRKKVGQRVHCLQVE